MTLGEIAFSRSIEFRSPQYQEVELCFMWTVVIDEWRLAGVSSSMGGSDGKALSSHCEKRLRRELGVPALGDESGLKRSRFSVGALNRVELPEEDLGRCTRCVVDSWNH